MEEVKHVHKWVESRNDFLWLQQPNQENVTCYNLGDQTNEINNEVVLVCPFEAQSPMMFYVEDKFSLDVQDLSGINVPLNSGPEVKNSTSELQYVNQIEASLSKIRAKTLQKVVMAQTQWIENINIQPVSAFQLACKSKDTYNYLACIAGQLWLGSSPELLLKSDYQSSETVALAGTRLLTSAEESWGEKEVLEQSIVGAYLLETFEHMGFSQTTVGKSFTKTVGHIQHICNTITARNPGKTDWHKLLNALHPTPALAGFPKDGARQFIAKTEDFTRGLYGGYVGHKDADGLELFVNIRCARLFSQSAQLFAGAGINSDSNPQSEWAETNNKLEVIRSILL